MARRRRGASTPAHAAFRSSVKAGVRYDEEEEVYVGYAPALNIYSQANTEDRARRTLESTVLLFLRLAQSSPLLTGNLLAPGGHSRNPEQNDGDHADDSIRKVEEVILEQRQYDRTFDVPTSPCSESIPA